MKTKTITLEYLPFHHMKENVYRVAQVTDSIEYHPGTFLQQTDVQALCAADNWKVTIRQPKG